MPFLETLVSKGTNSQPEFETLFQVPFIVSLKALSLRLYYKLVIFCGFQVHLKLVNLKIHSM